MKDLLFIITAGDDSPEKARFALNGALRQAKSGRYNSVKVLLYGPSEKFVCNNDDAIKSIIKEMVSIKSIDSACVAIAKMYGVEDNLKDMGIELAPFGERLAGYVENDYKIITF